MTFEVRFMKLDLRSKKYNLSFDFFKKLLPALRYKFATITPFFLSHSTRFRWSRCTVKKK